MSQKEKHPVRKFILRAVIISLIAVAVIFVALYIGGFRYIKTTNGAGTTVKFLGTVDKSGGYYHGKLFYSGVFSEKATLETDGTVNYSNGDSYIGDMSGGFRNGKGKLTFANGDVYEGDFVNNAITGQGTFVFVTGDRYEGSVKDGKFDGSGTFTSADGSKLIKIAGFAQGGA